MKNAFILATLVAVGLVGYKLWQQHRASKARAASLTLLCETGFIEQAGPFIAKQKDPTKLTLGDLQQYGNELAAEGVRLAGWAQQTLPPDMVSGLASLKDLADNVAVTAFTDAQLQCPAKFEGVNATMVASLFGFTAAALGR